MLFLNYQSELLGAVWTTMAVSSLGFIGALHLGISGALGRKSKSIVIRGISTAYVEAIRNTPGLVQILLIYFGLPVIGLRFSPFEAGVIALSINGGAYMTEIIRSGIQAVPSGHIEAARTLGLNRRATFISVILPQAVRTVYPAIVNLFIEIILGSSVLSFISLNEITGVAQIINGETFDTMRIFGIAVILYLILTNLVSYGSFLLALAMFRAPGPVKAQRSKFFSKFSKRVRAERVHGI